MSRENAFSTRGYFEDENYTWRLRAMRVSLIRFKFRSVCSQQFKWVRYLERQISNFNRQLVSYVSYMTPEVSLRFEFDCLPIPNGTEFM